MFYITKEFEIPMSHRLSKNTRDCQYLHGHNFILKVTVKSKKLDENDMVIDYHDLKNIVNYVIDDWDHGICLNKCDEKLFPFLNRTKLHIYNEDPTSEILAMYFYADIKEKLKIRSIINEIYLHSIILIETNGSQTEYTED